MPEIDLILEDAQESSAALESIPEPDLSQPAVTQPGDLWLLGKHRIVCGNALHDDTYRTLMGKMRATVAFTDPPFNVKIDGHATGNGAIRHREFAMASGEMSEAEFVGFLNSSLRLLANYSANNSVHYVCIDWRHAGDLIAAGKQNYEEFLNLCVWVKDKGGMGTFYRSQHELVLVFRKGKGPHRNNVQLGQFGRNRTNVWEYPGIHTLSKQSGEGNLLALHLTVKPVKMVADALLDSSARGEAVIDAFLGPGTTLMAAEQMGRICCGIELDPSMLIPRFAAGNAIPGMPRHTQHPARSLVKWRLHMSDEYEVGYGKPPRDTQFQKGCSGNPKGRPKGSKSIPELVRKIFDERLVVKGPGRQRSITKLAAGITQLANKTASGDLKAIQQAIQLREKVQEQDHSRSAWDVPRRRQVHGK